MAATSPANNLGAIDDHTVAETIAKANFAGVFEGV
jgi:hypothetical protein